MNETEDILHKVLTLDPTHVHAHNNIATILLGQ